MTEAGGDKGATGARPAQWAPLAALFDRLSTEGDGAPGYARLHFRLVTYFRLRFPADAEALADEAMDRLASRLEEGTPVLNLAGYALGIARLLVFEAGARQKKELDAAREAMLQQELSDAVVDTDAAVFALQSCLHALGSEPAALILEYYAMDSGATRIARREALAERLGLSLNALRNRALRIRAGLEKCVRARLQGEADPARDEKAISDT